MGAIPERADEGAAGRPVALLGRENVVLAAAVGLFAGVTVLRWYLDRSGQAAALLYVVPIALVAVSRGRRAGLAAATVGVCLFALFAALRNRGDLDLTGWMDPIVSMYLVGGLLGAVSEHAVERGRAAALECDRRRLAEELCDRQQEALEATDLMVQGVAAAKWMMESGRAAQALDLLTATVEDSMARLSPALPRPCGLAATQEAAAGARRLRD